MADVEITVRDNGPLLVSGSFFLKDQDGGEFDLGDKDTIALCRCGESSNAPFCDGNHKTMGFQADNRAPQG